MVKTEIAANGHVLKDITNVNVILGRNGAGKSRFLRALDAGLAENADFYIRYVSPERAGVFRREGHIDTNIERDKNWLRHVRSRNQAENFKAASASLIREVEIIYLRRLQSSPSLRMDPDKNFQSDRLDKINSLLANITMEQEGANFIFKDHQGTPIEADQISSGESEAVALATEILYFFETISTTKFNVLLIDEPDVHLHPDLQARLAKFITLLIDELPKELKERVAICVSTHSTPFVCALATSPYTSIGNKDFGATTVVQTLASDQLRKVAPFFGHPLSLTLANDPLLILEGEDDERVWQQVARSAQGRIRLFPVLANTVSQQSELEKFCAEILPSLYDHPQAYSLRDGDGAIGDIEDIGPIKRFRLQCYAIENLLLTDECLALMGTTWLEFCARASKWTQENPGHRDVPITLNLVNSTDRLRNTKIKVIRQLICSINEIKKPWETVVGQTIGSLKEAKDGAYTIYAYLGEKMWSELNLPKILPQEQISPKPAVEQQ
jgi:hypothetical protein